MERAEEGAVVLNEAKGFTIRKSTEERLHVPVFKLVAINDDKNVGVVVRLLC